MYFLAEAGTTLNSLLLGSIITVASAVIVQTIAQFLKQFYLNLNSQRIEKIELYKAIKKSQTDVFFSVGCSTVLEFNNKQREWYDYYKVVLMHYETFRLYYPTNSEVSDLLKEAYEKYYRGWHKVLKDELGESHLEFLKDSDSELVTKAYELTISVSIDSVHKVAGILLKTIREDVRKEKETDD